MQPIETPGVMKWDFSGFFNSKKQATAPSPETLSQGGQPVQVGQSVQVDQPANVQGFASQPIEQSSASSKEVKPEMKALPKDLKGWDLLEQKTEAIKKELSYCSEEEVHHRFEEIQCPKGTAIAYGEGKYLHANRVGEGISKRAYIASQAPRIQEQGPFWKKVFDEQEAIIIDLTTELERQGSEQWHGAVKPYYPEKVNTPVQYGSLSITLKSIKGNLHLYEIEDSSGKKKQIQRKHYSDWKDFDAIDLSALLKLIEELEAFKNISSWWIHCRAGVGRTGTLITALILKEKIDKGEITMENVETALIDLILALRRQRGPAFVQTSHQFDLLLGYARHLIGLKRQKI
jgi:protein tyrosine phosphatase